MAVAITRTDLSTEELRGAADHGHLSGAPPVGAGPGSRWGVADGGGAGRRHGASDASGLGAPLQRGGGRGSLRPCPLGSAAATVGGSAGRVGAPGRGRPRSGAPWRGALALRRPSGGDQAALRGRDQRASRPPELNPTENIWEYLRKNYLALRVFDDYDAIVDACCAWPGTISSPCPIDSPPSPDENGPRCHELRRLV